MCYFMHVVQQLVKCVSNFYIEHILKWYFWYIRLNILLKLISPAFAFFKCSCKIVLKWLCGLLYISLEQCDSRTGVDKLRHVGQIWPATCFLMSINNNKNCFFFLHFFPVSFWLFSWLHFKCFCIYLYNSLDFASGPRV